MEIQHCRMNGNSFASSPACSKSSNEHAPRGLLHTCLVCSIWKTKNSCRVPKSRKKPRVSKRTKEGNGGNRSKRLCLFPRSWFSCPKKTWNQNWQTSSLTLILGLVTVPVLWQTADRYSSLGENSEAAKPILLWASGQTCFLVYEYARVRRSKRRKRHISAGAKRG